jgi:hypothetical protein
MISTSSTRAANNTSIRIGLRLLSAGAAIAWSNPLPAQSVCISGGYRVIGRSWDAVLNTAWELRQDCAHPEWPGRTVAVLGSGLSARSRGLLNTSPQASPLFLPLLIHAGDPVRLWQRDARVRIEMSGIAEQSAHSGERVVVRVTRQTEDAGVSVQRFSGIARSSGDVEMER